MFRSRLAVYGLRNAHRPPPLRRNFHATRRHGSPSSPSFFETIHLTYDIPYILAIPLFAAGVHVVRLIYDFNLIRRRLRINQVKPLQQAEKIMYARAAAAGTNELCRSERALSLAERHQWSRKVLLARTWLPVMAHATTTALVLYNLRSATGVPQAFRTERVGDLINAVVENHSIQDFLLPYLESMSIFTAPQLFDLLGYFCVYQAFKLVRTTQLWRGWRIELVLDRLTVQAMTGEEKDKWATRTENGLITVVPKWVEEVTQINKTGLVNWLGGHEKPYLAALTSVVLLGAPVLTLQSLLNPAQLFYVAAALTSARLRASVASLYQRRQEAKWKRKNQEWEPLTPVYRSKSRFR